MKYQRTLFSILLIITVTSCAAPVPFLSGATATPTLTATPTETPLPTATPTPLPTPTPQPTERIQSGDLYLQTGEYDLALQEYQNVLSSTPDEDSLISAKLGIGRIDELQGEYATALDIFREIIDAYPAAEKTSWAYYYYAQALSHLERYAEAAEAYGKYLEMRPGRIDSYVQELKGDALTAAGDIAGAESAYRSALLAPRLDATDTLVVKIAQSLTGQGRFNDAVDELKTLYAATTSDYTKADIDLLLGQNYLSLGDTETAYQVFQEAVTNYPRSINSYYALVALIDAGIVVNEFNRGLVDYYAGQDTPAIEAFDRYMAATPDHDGTALYYKGLALRDLGNYEDAITAWNTLIISYQGNQLWTDSWDEIGYTQWYYMSEYGAAAQTYLDYVARVPEYGNAPDALFQAARNLERDGQLDEAIATWERVADEYSTSDYTFQSLFLAGITRYRQGNISEARTTFQRALVLTSESDDQAAAYLWIGKTQQADGQTDAAAASWQQAAEKDPTGYYSERARQLQTGEAPFSNSANINLSYDLDAERLDAESWLRTTFNIPAETNLADLGALRSDPRFIRGTEFWSLGLWNEARSEFESLRDSVSSDPVQTFILVGYFTRIGLYRSAIYASRQILTLAGMDDAATLNAPVYFNHIRFGMFYKDLVFSEAQSNDISPLFLLSVIRQESLFEGFAYSSAGAMGLMQIIPSTGESEAQTLGWPANFSAKDLNLPVVSLRLGTHYLGKQLNYFNENYYAALAAYNSGPGNAIIWQELAGDDPDLYLEVVRIEETRNYLKGIYELYNIYQRVYTITPG